MVDLIVQAIVTLVVLGFLYWVWTKLRPLFAQFIAEPFMGWIDVAIIVLVGAIVVFWFVLPLIRLIPRSFKFSEYGLNLLPLVT